MKIFKEGDIEYIKDGHLQIDGFDYYSIKTYKEEFEYCYENIVNNEKQNDEDSEVIKKGLNSNEIKRIRPQESSKFKYINCYPLEVLDEFYTSYFNN